VLQNICYSFSTPISVHQLEELIKLKELCKLF
jgi:hypothetical protein